LAPTSTRWPELRAIRATADLNARSEKTKKKEETTG